MSASVLCGSDVLSCVQSCAVAAESFGGLLVLIFLPDPLLETVPACLVWCSVRRWFVANGA